MIELWKRLAAVVVMGTTLGGVLSWTAGLWPGDEGRASVNHCYITYDRQEAMHGRCVGDWARGGRGHRGPIYGVDVDKSWKVIDEEPNSAYEWEVAVPASAKRPWVLADSGQAWVLSPRALPWGAIPAAIMALLIALAWSITVTVKAHKATRKGRWPEPDPNECPAAPTITSAEHPSER
ncbi:hypothetical protein [Micromonospora sp. NPDC023633]|uniref:hypothetical protein n=1 Tax=Micromonospora sp. NPDC023633 TaxID=3154320 RepID=UPI0033EC33A1